MASTVTRLTVPFGHTLATRLACGPGEADFACVLCAWHTTQLLGPRVEIALTAEGETPFMTTAESLLAETLNARALSGQTTRLAAVIAGKAPN